MYSSRSGAHEDGALLADKRERLRDDCGDMMDDDRIYGSDPSQMSWS
jgi:hypothetical protein